MGLNSGERFSHSGEFSPRNKNEILTADDFQGIALRGTTSILPRISLLRKGSKSVSKHGFCFSQPVCRYDGCGSAMTRGLVDRPPVAHRVGERGANRLRIQRC
jgi:hypothetical protein